MVKSKQRMRKDLIVIQMMVKDWTILQMMGKVFKGLYKLFKGLERATKDKKIFPEG